MLPDFTAMGLLPAGEYLLTLAQLLDSMLVVGPPALVAAGAWDAVWRTHLVNNLAVLTTQLWQVGIDRIFINGSFVEAKAHPNDIDGYFETDLRSLGSGRLEAALNAIDSLHAWTWDVTRRRFDPDSGKWQLPMWHAYHVELYPHVPGLLSGIRDQYGHELEFPSAFRQQRTTFAEKGIIAIEKDAGTIVGTRRAR